MDQLPFSQACENNKAFILDVLRDFFASSGDVLEIASGTGQHAVHFAANMPWLRWQPTEIARHMDVLAPRCAGYPGDNLLPPGELDVTEVPWRIRVPDAVFTANSLHIMPVSAMEALFTALATSAPASCRLAIYGPFNYDGKYTSDSNAGFDQWLASQSPHSGIRDFEMVEALAASAGFQLHEDVPMPANNRLLLLLRSTTGP